MLRLTYKYALLKQSLHTKRPLFNDNKRTKPGRPMETIEDKVIKSTQRTKDQFYKDALNRKGHDHPNRSDRWLSPR